MSLERWRQIVRARGAHIMYTGAYHIWITLAHCSGSRKAMNSYIDKCHLVSQMTKNNIPYTVKTGLSEILATKKVFILCRVWVLIL